MFLIQLTVIATANLAGYKRTQSDFVPFYERWRNAQIMKFIIEPKKSSQVASCICLGHKIYGNFRYIDTLNLAVRTRADGSIRKQISIIRDPAEQFAWISCCSNCASYFASTNSIRTTIDRWSRIATIIIALVVVRRAIARFGLMMQINVYRAIIWAPVAKISTLLLKGANQHANFYANG